MVKKLKNIRRTYFQENNHIVSIISLVVASLSLILTFCFLFLFASPWASTWDQVDFALALNRFDLLAMQPHFPGYPYFILGGTIIHQFIENEAKALAIFNGLLLLSAILPLYLLFRAYLKKSLSLLGVALIMSSVYTLLTAAQPMSEGSAIAVLWWYLWSLYHAKKSNSYYWKILPLFLFSILLGIRLSYLPFGFGIIILWWKEIKQRHYVRIGSYVGLAVLFQLIWVFALIHSEGGIHSFLKLALSFTNGHFNDWGGAVTTSTSSLGERLFNIVIYNFVWVGLCAKVPLILLMWLILLLLIRRGKRSQRIDYSILIQGGVYFLWAFFAQNVEKPRHILPLIAIGLFYFLVLLLQRMSILIGSILLFTLITQQVMGFTLLKQQAETLPATYQMAYDSHFLDENDVLYTWEESRVLDYLQVPFIHKPIFTYNYFLQDKMNYRNATIYLTDHVVKGFQMQGVDVKKHLEKVTEFRSNPLFDPVYSKISIYKWIE